MTITPRYEFTGTTRQFYGRTLRQIRALVTITSLAVNIGDLGGWIEKESNFPHDSEAWIHAEATVCDYATIRGGTIWGGTIWGGTIWGGNIWGGNIRGGTIWGGDIWGGDILEKQPLFLGGLTWPITVTDEHMAIGCQRHTLAEWWAFDRKQIAAMDRGATVFWKAHKPMLQALCAATGRPAA